MKVLLPATGICIGILLAGLIVLFDSSSESIIVEAKHTCIVKTTWFNSPYLEDKSTKYSDTWYNYTGLTTQMNTFTARTDIIVLDVSYSFFNDDHFALITYCEEKQ